MRMCYIDNEGNMRDAETDEIVATLGENNDGIDEYTVLSE